MLKTKTACQTSIYLQTAWFFFFSLLSSPSEIALGQAADPISAEDAAFFENKIRPILVEHCAACHGAEEAEGGLRIDSRSALLEGGDSGVAFDIADPEQSLLLSAVRYEDYEMPPSGQLSEDKIELLEQWVTRGIPWPNLSSEGDSSFSLRSAAGITDADKDYWAFRPLSNPQPPVSVRLKNHLSTSANATADVNPIDAFLDLRLRESGIGFAARADDRTLARRLYLDLLGVPPTEGELSEFLADNQPEKIKRLADRLLEDSRYGEKWARHWLDLVRYAESDGFKQDDPRPTAYLYRDWVIKSLNADVPYDQFVRLQLAGDELYPDDPNALVATGYLRHWIYEYNQRDAASQWSNILNDITDVTGEVFLGLGVGCARCHDHKFDPILQKDYYRLQASFAALIPREDALFATPDELMVYREQLNAWEESTKSLRAELEQLEGPIRSQVAKAAYNKFPLDIRPLLFEPAEHRNGYAQQIFDLAQRQVAAEWARIDFSKRLKGKDKEHWEELQDKLQQTLATKPKRPAVILAAGRVRGPAPTTAIPAKNESPESVLPARFEVFGGADLLPPQEVNQLAELDELKSAAEPASAVESMSFKVSSQLRGRRSMLAEWLNSAENPLPHRVIVNRVWQYHFGQGLVENANDFGRLGSPPTHPELLDFLANWFLEHGRSLKQLHRLIVTSEAFLQSSQPSPELAAAGEQCDPNNELLWKYPTRRLDAEQIRDSLLVASGAMMRKEGGPSAAHNSLVRTIYTTVNRNSPNPLLNAFDAPDYTSSVGKRNATTTPNQSLLMTNAPWPRELAMKMADDLQKASSKPELHIESAFLRTYQRKPNAMELESVLQFLREATEPQAAELQTSELPQEQVIAGESRAEDWYRSDRYAVALAELCHVLFNSSEFLYLD